MNHVLIFATYAADSAAAVILDGTTVYHEDGDKGHSQEFAAVTVAERLAAALGCPISRVDLTAADLGEDWGFDAIESAAVARV